MFAGAFANQVKGPGEEEFRDEGCFGLDLRPVFIFFIDEELGVLVFGLGVYFHFKMYSKISQHYREVHYDDSYVGRNLPFPELRKITRHQELKLKQFHRMKRCKIVKQNKALSLDFIEHSLFSVKKGCECEK
jgi:hypothetical protein